MAITNETHRHHIKKRTSQGNGRFTKMGKNPGTKRYVKKNVGQGGRKR